MFLGGVNGAGRVLRTISAPAGTDPFIAGIRYSGASLCIQLGNPPANAPMLGGMARDDQGVLYVSMDAFPGTPYFNGGLLCNANGAVYGTLGTAIAGYSQGMPVDISGRICFA